MIYRYYQERFVKKSFDALKLHQGVLGVGATGCGKTVMLSGVANQFDRVLVLQHRTELLEQNSKTFGWVNPDLPYGLVDSKRDNWLENYTFGMTQTIARRLEKVPAYDLIVVDEAHHTAANQHEEIIDAVRDKNPDAKLFGVTATPERADKKDLSKFYDVISDKIEMNELIEQGYLVPPKAYVIEVADKRELRKAQDDDEKIEALLNVKATNDRVIEEWKARAGNRQTVIFCQTRQHAIDVTDAFKKAGIDADYVDGVMSDRERKRKLNALDKGKLQVIVNVNVLIEGFDSQPISCVILLRGSSSKSSLIQMVGRGLRKLEPSRYPNVIKNDCIVLDFGVSLIRHGNLDAGDRLSFDTFDDTDEAVIQCDKCGFPVEPKEHTCSFCGYKVREEQSETEGGGGKQEKRLITSFTMTELELFERANFHYERFRGESFIASAWTAFALVHPVNGVWYTVAAATKKHAKIIGCTTNKIEALATGEDFLSQNGDPKMAGKNKYWLYEQATKRQLDLLPDEYRPFVKTKHQACCMLVLCTKFERIQKLINKHYAEVGRYYLPDL